MKNIFFLFIISQFIFGLSGLELAQKVEDRNSPFDMKSTMTMKLTNKKVRQEHHQFAHIQKMIIKSKYCGFCLLQMIRVWHI